MLLKSPKVTAFVAATAALTLISCGRSDPKESPVNAGTAEPAPELLPPPPAPTTSPLLASTSVFEKRFVDTPVNWRLWNDDAFALAEKHQRPVFALIGYSVCPWCERMKENVFSDPKIAAFINQNFIPVIVDAELHTGVNRIFMAYIQASKRLSGWPLNVFLTPGGAPLSAASYMTVDGSNGNPGFLDVAGHIHTQWTQFPEHYSTQALRDLEPLITRFEKKGPDALVRPSADMVATTVASLAADFDPLSGGFNSQPKFIFPPRLEFLLAHANASSTDEYGKKRALDMVTATLDSAALSATRDILSGGFFRYSTDPYWNGPNFEKHLADQALNAAVYSTAYEASESALYREVVYETFRFLENTFASPAGTFYSSQATGFVASTSSIGSYFTWTPEEIHSVIDSKSSLPFARAFGIKSRGNLSSSSSLHSELKGRNVLIPKSLSATKKFATEIGSLATARSGRTAPLIDQSIALIPNAYAATALARAGRVFQDPSLTSRAENLLGTLQETHCGGTPIPAVRNTLGDTKGPPAFSGEYAAIIAAYLEMHRTTSDPKWLTLATTVQDAQTEKFYDTKARGFFAEEASDYLFTRIKPVLDASTPSVNSLSVLNLITLANTTSDTKYRKQAWETLYGLSPSYAHAAGGSTTMIQALGVLLDSGQPGE